MWEKYFKMTSDQQLLSCHIPQPKPLAIKAEEIRPVLAINSIVDLANHMLRPQAGRLALPWRKRLQPARFAQAKKITESMLTTDKVDPKCVLINTCEINGYLLNSGYICLDFDNCEGFKDFEELRLSLVLDNAGWVVKSPSGKAKVFVPYSLLSDDDINSTRATPALRQKLIDKVLPAGYPKPDIAGISNCFITAKMELLNPDYEERVVEIDVRIPVVTSDTASAVDKPYRCQFRDNLPTDLPTMKEDMEHALRIILGFRKTEFRFSQQRLAITIGRSRSFTNALVKEMIAQGLIEEDSKAGGKWCAGKFSKAYRFSFKSLIELSERLEADREAGKPFASPQGAKTRVFEASTVLSFDEGQSFKQLPRAFRWLRGRGNSFDEAVATLASHMPWNTLAEITTRCRWLEDNPLPAKAA